MLSRDYLSLGQHIPKSDYIISSIILSTCFALATVYFATNSGQNKTNEPLNERPESRGIDRLIVYEPRQR
jgi:hypothetical protein